MSVKIIYRFTRWVTLLLAAGVVVYALILIVHGRRFDGMSVQWLSGQSEITTSETWFMPDPLAILFLFAGSIIFIGQIIENLSLSWGGLLVLAASSILLVFSIGFPLLPIVIILLITHIVMQFAKVKKNNVSRRNEL
jgi:hypothetical protein